MTPADHAATVRGSMREDMRDRGDCPERSGVCWCRQNAAHDALDKIVALAERATELEERVAHLEHLLQLWPGQGPMAREVATELRAINRRAALGETAP